MYVFGYWQDYSEFDIERQELQQFKQLWKKWTEVGGIFMPYFMTFCIHVLIPALLLANTEILLSVKETLTEAQTQFHRGKLPFLTDYTRRN